MTAASAPAFPDSKVLAAWWKNLAPRTPRNVWIAHLLLHRVDALARSVRPAPLDPLEHFVLRAVTIIARATPDLIAQQLELPPAFVHRILRRLGEAGLVHDEKALAWRVTPSGIEAIKNGIYGRREKQRRSFYFIENDSSLGHPEYVNLISHPDIATWPTKESWRFDAAVLKECLVQPPEWKRQRGFPEEIIEIVDAATDARPVAPAAENWQSIILDQSRLFPALLLDLPERAGAASLLGFAIDQERWALQTDVPVFKITAPGQHILPGLTDTPRPEDWRQAWRAWCGERGLLTLEAEGFELEQRRCTLHVSVTSSFLRSLRNTAGGALRGEAWLLAGAGSIRMAARLEFTEIGA